MVSSTSSSDRQARIEGQNDFSKFNSAERQWNIRSSIKGPFAAYHSIHKRSDPFLRKLLIERTAAIYDHTVAGWAESVVPLYA